MTSSPSLFQIVRRLWIIRRGRRTHFRRYDTAIPIIVALACEGKLGQLAMSWGKSGSTAALSAAPSCENDVFSDDNGGRSSPARGACRLVAFLSRPESRRRLPGLPSAAGFDSLCWQRLCIVLSHLKLIVVRGAHAVVSVGSIPANVVVRPKPARCDGNVAGLDFSIDGTPLGKEA
jgi:hypothetical protein